MDANKENIAASGVPGCPTGGVMDGMMHHDARSLIDMLIKGERMEICLYKELAATAPSTCLKEIFLRSAAEDIKKAERLAKVAAAYGLKHVPCPPHYYAEAQKQEKE